MDRGFLKLATISNFNFSVFLKSEFETRLIRKVLRVVQDFLKIGIFH